MEAREEPAGPSGRSLAAEEWQADYFKAIPELEQLARYVQIVQHWSNILVMPEARTAFNIRAPFHHEVFSAGGSRSL